MIEIEHGRPKKKYIAYGISETYQPGFPKSFFRLQDLPEKIHQVKAGDWIETKDGYVVQVHESNYYYIHLPSSRSLFYKKSIAKKKGGKHKEPYQPKLFLTDEEKQERRDLKRFGGNHLNEADAKFAWEFAKSWDGIKALKASGLNGAGQRENHQRDKRLIKNKLEKPVIVKGIMQSIQIHLQAMEMGGEELALTRKNRLLGDLEQVVQMFKQRLMNSAVQSSTEELTNEYKLFMGLAGRLSKEIDGAAEWLGYGAEQKQQDGSNDFNFAIMSNSGNNFSLNAPRDPMEVNGHSSIDAVVRTSEIVKEIDGPEKNALNTDSLSSINKDNYQPAEIIQQESIPKNPTDCVGTPNPVDTVANPPAPNQDCERSLPTSGGPTAPQVPPTVNKNQNQCTAQNNLTPTELFARLRTHYPE